MPSQWLALGAGDDSRTHARQLRQSWERLLAGRELKSESAPQAPGGLRQPIVESWTRSLDSGLDPLDLLAPLEADPSEMRERWHEHPLGSLAQGLLAQLADTARESESLIVVSDASGLLLRIEGPDSLKERAAEMNFVEGARYSEAAAGTSGIGSVLAADHALQVFAFEHFNQRHHGWTCSGAPIHDPVSGRTLGVIDLSSPWELVHPRSLNFVIKAAEVLEQFLADARRERDARLRRRYGGLVTRETDLLVSPEGLVLAGGRLGAQPKPLAVPEGGGEILLGDGSRVAAEPLGHGEAYLVRSTGPRGLGAHLIEEPKPIAGQKCEQARGGKTALQHAGRREAGVSPEGGRTSGDSDPSVRTFLTAVLDCVILADASGRVVEFNPAAERTFGYRRNEALGRTIAELIVPPPLRERHTAAFARFIESGDGNLLGRRLELIGVRADGSEFPVELTLTRLEGDPPLICGALRDISAAKQAEAHLREFVDEQAALRRVATLVAHQASPQQVFAAVAEQVARIVNVPLVRVVRYEDNGSKAELIGGWGESVDPIAIGERWDLDGPGVIASVWESRRPARFDNYTGVPGQAAAVVRQAGMRSALASPITVEGRLWGAIAVFSPVREPLPERAEARLADFTELVATALANAESRAELAASEARARKLADEQAALRRVATLVARESLPEELFAVVAEEVGRLMNVPLVALARYEPDGAAIQLVGGWGEGAVPIGRYLLDGPSGFLSVWETRKPARTGDSTDLPGEIAAARRQLGLKSSVASPILVEGRLWGVISVASSEPLPEDTEVRILDFTELVATAIANSEARDNVRRLVDEQAALRRVATLVAEGAAPAVLFSAVTEEVAQLFEPAAVTLNRYEGDVCTVLAASGIGFPVGSRWPLDVDSLAARVYTAGRPVHANYTDIAGATPREVWEGHPSESDLGVPIVVDGSLWGVFCVATPELDRNPSETAERIGRFTELVATAVSNATIRADLIASRARVVATADETRRRIERDLHDGAQQQLVTLALGLRATEGRIPVGMVDLKTEVGRAADRLTSVIDELREMSRGIHPAILTQGGLSPALEALALRSSVPVKLNVRCEHRLPDKIEVAAYYVTSEALTNAAKHANASHVRVDLRAEEDALRLSISDDGEGGADASGGSGLVGIKDRVEALGGTIEVKSPPRGGTRLGVEIPLIADRSAEPDLQPLSPV
jgi:PAS domain S-box-containing protein